MRGKGGGGVQSCLKFDSPNKDVNCSILAEYKHRLKFDEIHLILHDVATV